MGLSYRPLTPSVGTEVSGVDLRQDLSPKEVQDMSTALSETGVLVFHDQNLTKEEQGRFARRFGDIQGLRGDPAHLGSEFHYIGNVAVDGMNGAIPNGDMTFHQDGAYAEDPPSVTMLYALEIPATGGNTLFCSTDRAYRALAADLQRKLQGYDVHFIHDYALHNKKARRERGQMQGLEAVHPLVIKHPVTGRPLLFCSTLMTDRIVGLSESDSDALVETLCAELERPEHIYEHVWAVGDLVVWDNLTVQHARTDFDPGERRSHRRMQLVGRPLTPFRDTAAEAAEAFS